MSKALSTLLCLFGTATAFGQLCPELVGYYDVLGANSIDVEGDYAYVVDRSSSPYFVVLDISSPSSPSQVGGCDSWGDSVDVVGDYAYVAGGSAGLRVVDVSTPGSPTEVGLANTPGEAQDVEVVGSYAYVADHSKGLRIIDVSNPLLPSEVGFLEPISSYVDELAVNYPYVYLSRSYDTGSGFTYHLLVIDVSDATSPTEVGTFQLGNALYDIKVVGTLVFVASGQGGLRIIDVSTPASPQEIGSYAPWGNIWGVAISGDIAFLGNYQRRLHVVDISDPAAPSEIVPYLDTVERANRVLVRESDLFVVGRPDIYDITCMFGPVFLDGFESGDLTAWSTGSGG